ncbi:MAG: S8 family serine peptidase, partial [Patescibacteria group bacterium]|nr:S8 family serine peptidase [Patescibacteria group bacterium]
MHKETLKKSFAGFMVVAILSGTMAPVSLIFAAEEMRGDNDLLLEKLESKQLEKVKQLRDFDGEGKMKTFSTDESLKKMAETKQLEKPNYVEGEVLVKFKERKINLEYSSGRTKAMQFAVSKSLDKKEDIRKSNISVLKIKDTKTVEEKIAELKNDSRVEYVQPNFLYYPLTIDTNDIYKDKLWGLDNTGQEVNGVSGTPNADINIVDAWEISEGAESEDDIIVAVIDSGVAYNHPDLIDNMWDGSNCVDDEGNLLGGCQHGYDYEDDDKFPLDNDGHGTHIAGTIGAVKNNNKGIIGVAPNVKIMALKSSLTTADNISSINFAGQNGAKVINASWGGPSNDLLLKAAIESFTGLFIASAGNGKEYGNSNIGDNHGSEVSLYPCDYTSDNIIC